VKIGSLKPVVVLVSPKGALNVGGVARLMGNFGLSEMRLVEPRCELSSSECKQMAIHSYPIVQNAKIFDTLSDALSDLTQVIALSGRKVEDRRPSASLADFVSSYSDQISSNDRVGLVFGREEIGLKLEELCQCHWQIEIPTHPDWFSINLTSAVGITLYEFFRRFGEPMSPNPGVEIVRPLQGQRELFFERLQKLLDRVKFSNKENPLQLRDDLWALLHRSDVDDREMRILFGILTSVEQALDRSSLTDKNPTPP